MSPRPRLCDRAVVAMTGSIGTLWAAQFVLDLRTSRRVRGVRVIMSESAARFVTPSAMRAISGAPVLTDLFDAGGPYDVGHIQVAEDADVMIVMPATANIVGKVAHGIADEIVSACVLGASCPVLFVPTMNPRMWRQPVVQRNVRQLTSDGFHVVPPEPGIAVSTLRTSEGGMASFDAVIEAAESALRPRAATGGRRRSSRRRG